MTDRIADLPRDERPRERMQRHGAQALSDAELLALLLGSGTRGRSAVHVARDLLADGLTQLGRRDFTELARTHGVGAAKASRIAAAFEIARRMHMPESRIAYAADTFGASLIRTHQFHQEHLGAALLDTHDRLLKNQTIFVGTINSALVSTREIVRYAVLNNAAGVVLYHNHPSGNATPSAHDSLFTKKMREALQLVDIALVDHLVIGADRYSSMKEKGWI